MSRTRFALASILLAIAACSATPPPTPAPVPVASVEPSASVAAPPPPRTCSPDDVSDCRDQCRAGDPPSCASLGALYAKGEHGAPKDPAIAAAAFQKACDGNIADSCAQLADLTREGKGV